MASAAVPQHVARRAVEWMVELQTPPVSDELRREWARWLASDPDHARAWQRIEAVNERLRGLGGAGGEQHPAIASALLTPRGSARRRHAVKALSLLVATGALAWTAEEQLPWRSWQADERTGTGQRRSLALADGSRIVLNSASAVDLDDDGQARRLQLHTGEILVTTGAARMQRPLLVQTTHGVLEAVPASASVAASTALDLLTTAATRFAVRLFPQGTQVSVFGGAVAVRPRAPGDAAPVVLQAGQQVLFGNTAIMPVLAADEDSVAWTDGFLVAKSMGLAAFLAELERYSTLPLGCAPELASLRVSGSYQLDDIGRVLETLAAAFELEIQTTTRLFGLYRSGIRLAPRQPA